MEIQLFGSIIGLLLVLILSLLLIRPFLEFDSYKPSITTVNTTFNTRENGGTGAKSRNERRRRGYRRKTWSDDSDDDDDDDNRASPAAENVSVAGISPGVGDSGSDRGSTTGARVPARDHFEFRIISRPIPETLRSVLKPAKRKRSSSLLATLVEKASTLNVDPTTIGSFTGLTAANSKMDSASMCEEPIKQVRIVEPEPCKMALATLREIWAIPSSSSSNGTASSSKSKSSRSPAWNVNGGANTGSTGSGSGGGIGGYRRTRDIYAKGQANKAVDPNAMERAKLLANALSGGGANGEDETTDESSSAEQSLSTGAAAGATTINIISSSRPRSNSNNRFNSTSSFSAFSSSSLLARSSSPSFAVGRSASPGTLSVSNAGRRQRSSSVGKSNGTSHDSTASPSASFSKIAHSSHQRFGSRLKPAPSSDGGLLEAEDAEEGSDFEDVEESWEEEDKAETGIGSSGMFDEATEISIGLKDASMTTMDLTAMNRGLSI